MSLWINKDKSTSLFIAGEYGYANFFTSFYGRMSMNKKFEKVTIQIYDQVPYGGGWSSENGWVISAPCSNRNEAVRLSNELLPYIFRGSIK